MRFTLALAAAIAVVPIGCAGRPAVVPATANPLMIDRAPDYHFPIQHVVIIFQENRTPDNLFQGLPGADIARSGLNDKGREVRLHAVPLTAKYDLQHEHSGFAVEYDGGKMDGWSQEHSSNDCGKQFKAVCAYGYVPRSENRPYITMAKQYAFADRMFQSNQGPSYPAHQFIISGDSVATPKSPLNVSSNPIDHGEFHGGGGGCDAPPWERVHVINRQGFQRGSVYPCFDRKVLSDLIDAKGLSWRYYQYGGGQGLWKAFDSIQHVRYGPDYRNVVSRPQAILSDIARGDLANVVWVTPQGHFSDHSGSGYGGGPAWVSAVVNAIGKSSYWDTTAIFITWDDWGGWFDHVKPPIVNSYELGFRVPLIVVSPYAKAGYVSHERHEFGSILKFTEETFALGSLGTTDARSDNLRDCFDFTQTPRRFRTIPAPPFTPDDPVGKGASPNDPSLDGD